MDEMFNKMMAEMGKLTEAIKLMTEKLDALKLPAVAVPLVEEAMAEAAKSISKKKAPAAKKEEPKVEAPVVETREEIPAATVEAFAKEFSSDDVRSAIKEVMDKKGTPAAKEIINGVGNAPNVSAIPVEKHAAVVNACLEACK